jgi:hypothetical protein
MIVERAHDQRDARQQRLLLPSIFDFDARLPLIGQGGWLVIRPR